MNCLDTDPSTEKELPLIECAQRLGCKYYMIDAGWYTDGFWWDDTGEWRAAPTRFRGGLAFVLEEIRRRGMIPGLWVEIEVMSEALPFANALPDGWFSGETAGVCGTTGGIFSTFPFLRSERLRTA